MSWTWIWQAGFRHPGKLLQGSISWEQDLTQFDAKSPQGENPLSAKPEESQLGKATPSRVQKTPCARSSSSSHIVNPDLRLVQGQHWEGNRRYLRPRQHTALFIDKIWQSLQKGIQRGTHQGHRIKEKKKIVSNLKKAWAHSSYSFTVIFSVARHRENNAIWPLEILQEEQWISLWIPMQM